MIVVIDYEMGNVGSITNMVKKIGYDCVVSSSQDVISEASKLILPGVGAYDKGVNNLEDKGLFEFLNSLVVHDKKPILGICLGMQLMTHRREEGSKTGFGWLDAETVKFSDQKLVVPHMGWNYVTIENSSMLCEGLDQNSRFYFVHSYKVVCRESSDIVLKTFYGEPFCSAFQKENIFGVQFHPEKSHSFGLKLLSNFLNGDWELAKK